MFGRACTERCERVVASELLQVEATFCHLLFWRALPHDPAPGADGELQDALPLLQARGRLRDADKCSSPLFPRLVQAVRERERTVQRGQER